MTIDPMTGIDLGPRRGPDKHARDIDAAIRASEERRAFIWLPLAVGVVVLLGIIYFIGTAGNKAQQATADSGAVTRIEPSPN